MNTNLHRGFSSNILICTALVLFAATSHGDWVAYNDHAPGPGTSPNATTYNIRTNASGFLKDIASGRNLPVTLIIKTNGPNIIYGPGSANPSPGTPLDNTFHGFVDFASATDAVAITNSTVTYTFTNLPPAPRYNFRGGAVRGLPGTAGTNRWTRVAIVGADSFVSAHSSNVVTSAQAPGNLGANEVAANFAMNNTVATGDMVGWDSIDPGPDGTFSIICSQYQGFVPKGIVPPGGHSNGTNAFAITGIRLEQLPSGPPVITTQPQDQSVNVGETATFTVTATGEQPLRYQWYRNNTIITGATNSGYTTPATTLSDHGARFSVIVYNSLGNLPSTNATLIVIVPPVVILPLTNSWKYNQDGIDLGTAWRTIGYDDSSWLSGAGVLGHETNNPIVMPLTNTVLSLFNSNNVYVDTFYFRTHFTLADPYTTLTASNLIDDGAVFFLNGQEVSRLNIVAAPDVVVYRTLANAAIEAAWTSFVIPSSLLVQGDNLLAVEVHQGSPNSSDIVMGMSLHRERQMPSPLVITANPPGRTVKVGSDTTFTVGYTGGLPNFQWYKWVNGVPVSVPGAAKESYPITNVSLEDAGYYFVTASNALGVVSSVAALLNVTIGTSGPKLVLADGSLNSSNVTVAYSEFLSAASATNIANYQITNTSSGVILTITGAVLENGTNVILTTGARVDGVNYILTVNNVRDRGGNIILPNSRIPVATLLTLIDMEQTGWAYYIPVVGFNPDPGVNWTQLNFAPSAGWATGGQALFAYDPQNNEFPAVKHTSFSPPFTDSSYFRCLFNFAPSLVGASIRLRHIVDDGIVAYLNGVEVYRFNMPAGVIWSNTPALVAIGTASSVGPIVIPTSSLRSGSNVLAVELHGAALEQNDPDLIFGAELLARVSSIANGVVLITSGPADLTIEEKHPFSLGFDGVGASTFQWRTNGTPIPGATNAVLSFAAAPLSWNGKLFSVVVSNSSGSTTSTNAKLTVTADVTSPALVSAVLASPTSVSVSFSEAITSASATALANYRITNSAGADLQISSAVAMNETNVILGVSPTIPESYRLVVNGIRDRSRANNFIANGSSAALGFQTSLPFSAVWRFYTNNADLGTAWRAINYPDTINNWSSGRGLIADESTPPPELIFTSISHLDNGVYHYTFYFRYHLFAPVAAKSAMLTFRHIIDDGAIFYFNGTEFHRFNMAAGPVDYLTQANTNATEGIYNGPFTAIVSNILAGDNVIAVEVHQMGNASSDITFGTEMSVFAPSVVFPTAAPPLLLSKVTGNLVLSWSGDGPILEQADLLSTKTVWTTVTNQANPYFITPPISAQRFYRLRQ